MAKNNNIDTVRPDYNDCKIIKLVPKSFLKELNSKERDELRNNLQLFNVWNQPRVFDTVAIYVDPDGNEKPLSNFICKRTGSFTYGKQTRGASRIVFKSTKLKDSDGNDILDELGKPTYILIATKYFADHGRDRHDYNMYIDNSEIIVTQGKMDSKKTRSMSKSTEYKILADLENSDNYEKYEYNPAKPQDLDIKKEYQAPIIEKPTLDKINAWHAVEFDSSPSKTLSKWAKKFDISEDIMTLVFRQVQIDNNPVLQIVKDDQNPTQYKIADLTGNYAKVQAYIKRAQMEYMDLDDFMSTYYSDFMSEHFDNVDKAKEFIREKCNDLLIQNQTLAGEYFYKLDNMLFFRKIGDKSGEFLSDILISSFPVRTRPAPAPQKGKGDTTIPKKAITKKLSSWVNFYAKKYPFISEGFMEYIFNLYGKHGQVSHEDGSEWYTIYINKSEQGKPYPLEALIKQKYENTLRSLVDVSIQYYQKYGYTSYLELYDALLLKCSKMLSDPQFKDVTQLYFYKYGNDIFFHNITDANGKNRIDEFIQDYLGKTPVATNTNDKNNINETLAADASDNGQKESRINPDWVGIFTAINILKDMHPLLGFLFYKDDLIGTDGYIERVSRYLTQINDGRKIEDFVRKKYSRDPEYQEFIFNVDKLQEFRNLMAEVDLQEATATKKESEETSDLKGKNMATNTRTAQQWAKTFRDQGYNVDDNFMHFTLERGLGKKDMEFVITKVNKGYDTYTISENNNSGELPNFTHFLQSSINSFKSLDAVAEMYKQKYGGLQNARNTILAICQDIKKENKLGKDTGVFEFNNTFYIAQKFIDGWIHTTSDNKHDKWIKLDELARRLRDAGVPCKNVQAIHNRNNYLRTHSPDGAADINKWFQPIKPGVKTLYFDSDKFEDYVKLFTSRKSKSNATKDPDNAQNKNSTSVNNTAPKSNGTGLIGVIFLETQVAEFIKILQKELDDATARVVATQDKNNAAQRQIDAASQEIQKSETEVNKITEQISEKIIQQDFETVKKLAEQAADLKQKKSVAKSRLEQATQRANETSAELETATQKRDSIKADFDKATNILRQRNTATSEKALFERMLADKDKDIERLDEELIKMLNGRGSAGE